MLLYFKGKLSSVAYTKQLTPYFYDRFFFVNIAFVNTSKGEGRFFAPYNFLPVKFRINFLIQNVVFSYISCSNQNAISLIYKFVFEVLGASSPKILIKSHGATGFDVNFLKSKKSFIDYPCQLVPLFFSSVYSIIDPLYTSPAWLAVLTQNIRGFTMTLPRLDFSFAGLRWLSLIQLKRNSFLSMFNLKYSSQTLLLMDKLSTVGFLQPVQILASSIGINPKFFSYKKIKQGLTFKVLYGADIFFKTICNF